ncbi:MAG: amino acid ABC transporter ATP-binding protein [Bifidobacterium sp.]|nr:amino acid ABC transporter ATP-binding protein [Bifidobacterium sp.]
MTDQNVTRTTDLTEDAATTALSTGDAPAGERPVLEVEGLVKRYPGADSDVFDGIGFSVPKGKVFVIVGPSGSGKSTLLRAIAGLEPIQGGTVRLDGQVVAAGTPEGKRARRARRPADLRTAIGMVFQSYDLFPNRTVLGNLTMAPVMVQKRDRKEVEAEAMRLLERVGLADRAGSRPHELSGGQRQRVAICRALIEHPQLLLLDEIAAALDPEMVHEVLDVVLELADEGQTMLIVTHEMQFARAVADSVIMIERGTIVEQSDDPERFFTDPRTERAREFLRTFEFARRRKDGGTTAGERAEAVVSVAR